MHIIWMLVQQLELFFFWSAQIVTAQYGKDMNYFLIQSLLRSVSYYPFPNSSTYHCKHAFWLLYSVSTYRSPNFSCKDIWCHDLFTCYNTEAPASRKHPASQSSLSKQALGHVWPAVWLWVRVRVVCFPDCNNNNVVRTLLLDVKLLDV